jgi:alpha-1,6-mannosyltransferase
MAKRSMATTVTTDALSQSQQQQSMSPPGKYNHTYYRWLGTMALATTMSISLWACPHSKVEESFPLQAVYDLFYHGLGPAIQALLERHFSAAAGTGVTATSHVLVDLPYDHTQFPGVVPRSFAGPGLLAVGSHMVHWMVWAVTAGWWNVKDHPAAVQSLARCLLMLANLHGWWCFATAVDQRQEQRQRQGQANTSTSTTSMSMIGTYLLLVTACQFHLPFYASRMLPNTFAVWLTLHCYAFWVRVTRVSVPWAAATLVTACAVFRCDMILLLFVCGLSWLITRQLTVVSAIQIGLVSGAVSLLVTVPLDSLLWQKWVWPEGQVFVFNAIQGKSQEWGVEPWYWYWTTALPRALLGTAVTIPLAVSKLMEHFVIWEERYRYRNSPRMTTTKVTVATDSSSKNSNWMVRKTHEWIDFTWIPILLPAWGFCALYSCLGHKETRFLFPVLPLWNLAAAVGLAKVHGAAFGSSNAGVLSLWSTPTTTTAVDNRNDSNALHKKDDDHPDSDTNLSPSLSFAASRPSLVGQLIYTGCIGLLLLTLAASSIFVAVSQWNYPGGQALTQLVQHIQKFQGDATTDQVRVHIDVASAMTGVSLFGQREATVRVPNMEWVFDKAGYEPENAIPGGGVKDNEEEEESVQAPSAAKWTSMYTHLLTENKSVVDPDLFRVVDVIQGNPRLDLRRARVATTDSIYILERRDFLESQ